MRILGDYHHSSRIAFVEFTMDWRRVMWTWNSLKSQFLYAVLLEGNL
ncbi:hypothetical protein ES319_D04G121100v1 [Gossypium barbadense]|uniref:RRM domain-containing protein n=1 Tax=Gossypium barbadense TaxID=3634 RepID=A0A5J5RUL0_GOSBA|nr:hypothetical protein ES319_D04G121100v1 [Gossypium barbadense]